MSSNQSDDSVTSSSIVTSNAAFPVREKGWSLTPDDGDCVYCWKQATSTDTHHCLWWKHLQHAFLLPVHTVSCGWSWIPTFDQCWGICMMPLPWWFFGWTCSVSQLCCQCTTGSCISSSWRIMCHHTSLLLLTSNTPVFAVGSLCLLLTLEERLLCG